MDIIDVGEGVIGVVLDEYFWCWFGISFDGTGVKKMV